MSERGVSAPAGRAGGLDLALVLSVKGFLAAAEAEHLYRVGREAAPLGPCLEIGSYCGRSAVCLGTACAERGQVLFSVDHHRGSEEQQPGEAYFDPALFDPRRGGVDTLPGFRETLRRARLEETVVPIVCASALAARAWRTPLALVFIDGGHALETVLADYAGWSPHLVPGGFLLFHDVFEDPAQGGRAPYEVLKLALASGLFEPHSRVESLAVLRRCGPPPADPAVFRK
ncbi:MAG: class I SAM-dependent methyltransferase [Desulfobacterales bacterium]